MNNKYELTEECITLGNVTLYRIRALKDFSDVKAGCLGGYIESTRNLSEYGNTWVYDNAKVYGNARVYGNAEVRSNADILQITGLGSAHRTTTIYKTINGDFQVICGCFSGNLEEFKAKITETHGSSKFAQEYLAFIEVAKIYFGLK